MWWRRKPVEWASPIQYNRTDYPSGACVRDTTDKIWYFLDGKRFHIPTERVHQSWRFASTGDCTPDAIAHIKIAGKLGFRAGTLIKNVADGRTYLIDGNKRRHITSPDVYDEYGLNRANTIEVSDDEVNLHNEGEALR